LLTAYVILETCTKFSFERQQRYCVIDIFTTIGVYGNFAHGATVLYGFHYHFQQIRAAETRYTEFRDARMSIGILRQLSVSISLLLFLSLSLSLSLFLSLVSIQENVINM